ncbi:transcription initiation factor IID, 18kD subunit-domain-containing protein, partial [Ephemerocybe angulata]
MSYTPYTPPASAGAPPPPTFNNGAYAGAYSYQNPYHTGVTSYGWPYPYAKHPAQTPAPAAPATAPAPVTAAVAPTTTATPAPPQRSTTFTTYTPTYVRDSAPIQSSTTHHGGGKGKRQSNMKGLFTKELKSLMYGFGDDRNPSNDTVSVMEEILIEYITDVCQVAGGGSKKSRLSIEDLRRALSRPADAKKLARLEELLFMQEDIKRARAQFEENDIQNPKDL